MIATGQKSLLSPVLLATLLQLIICAMPCSAEFPEIDPDVWVGRSAEEVVSALGPPLYQGSAVDGSRDVNYAWTRSVGVDAKVKFDGRGFPPEGLVTEQDTMVSCRVTFQVHRSGLVMSQTTMGACQIPKFVEGTQGSRDRTQLLGSEAAARYDGPDAAQRVVAPFGYMFVLDDYAGFDRYLDTLAAAAPLNDGRPQLALLPDALTGLFAAHRKWDDYRKRLERWRSEQPQSRGAVLAAAAYWLAYAWDARGSGYANTVSPEGAALFRDRVRKALRVLDEAPSTARDNPVWYQLKLSGQLYTGSAQEEMDATLEAGTVAFPRYWPLRLLRLSGLHPRWRGSFEAIDTYIARQVTKVDGEEQAVLYTRLYWATQQLLTPPASVFEQTHADWVTMAAGFRTMQKQFPISFWNRQNFAVFACRAGDAASYRELRPGIEEFIHHDAWQAPVTLDTCDYRLLTGS